MSAPALSPPLPERLLAFYDREGRDLPWRGGGDLYPIWVSEVMLQQTGVATVIPYFHRFLDRFPDIQTLAAAEMDAVLALWQGLGYYQRARNLHAAARQVMAEWGGCFPEMLADLLRLPGIGPNTGGAILAIGRDQPHAILDGNVKRVLARLSALPDPLSTTTANRRLWQLARELTPSHRPGDYAQAIMDLGATVCTRRDPACNRCPWQRDCQAFALGRIADFPVANPKKILPRRLRITVLVRDERGHLLLGRRPPRGLHGGLWESPSSDPVGPSGSPPAPADENAARFLLDNFGVEIANAVFLGTVRHTFTHFRLTVFTFSAQWMRGDPQPGAYTCWQWQPPSALPALPVSTLYRKLLALDGAGKK